MDGLNRLSSNNTEAEERLIALMKDMQDVHLEHLMAESPKIYDLLKEKDEDDKKYMNEISEKNCRDDDESIILSLPPEVREKIWKKKFPAKF